MSSLIQIRRLWDHAAWTDVALLSALESVAEPPAQALREYAHVLGAEETWLSRLQGRASRAAVWPELTRAGAAQLGRELRAGYEAHLASLTDEALDLAVTYTNSAGRTFSTPAGDILLHVVLHGQYHRGKVNLLLRQAGMEPAPVDFIGFVRGVPAATNGPARAVAP
ncbi:MAG TPA: DinB family protein [Gemmatimonadaceae bacterium]